MCSAAGIAMFPMLRINLLTLAESLLVSKLWWPHYSQRHQTGSSVESGFQWSLDPRISSQIAAVMLLFLLEHRRKARRWMLILSLFEVFRHYSQAKMISTPSLLLDSMNILSRSVLPSSGA